MNNTSQLYFKSKRISLTILAVTALVCSRALFSFIADLEGPNLLIVVVMALAIYLVSAGIYVFGLKNIAGISRLFIAIAIQALAVMVLYFCMR